MMPDDMALVREYARSHSEAAFAALVERHVNLVYSVALRQVRDAHLAEEIAQAVFVILARKAKALGPKVILPGWLCRTARYVSANALTLQRRRQRREQEACMQSVLNEPPRGDWSRIAPLLDDALARLGAKDHDAIVLRFFENRSLGEVGAAIGASEDTARMRVNRALVKLRQFFLQRGVDSTTAAIAETISANSILVAPAALAKTATAAALAHGATASTSTLTLIKGALKIMAWTKTKTAIVTGVAVLLTGVATFVTVKTVRYAVGGYSQQALEIVQKSRDAYAALSSYSDSGIITQNVGNQTLKTTFNIRLQRPDFYRIEWSQAITPAATSSGAFTSSGVVWSAGNGNFMVMKSGQNNLKPQTYPNMQAALAAATGVSGQASLTIPATFFNRNRGDVLNPANATLQKEGGVNGVDCYVVSRSTGPASNLGKTVQKTTITLWIGKEDHLIHQIKTEMENMSIKLPQISNAEMKKMLEAHNKPATPEAIAAAKAHLTEVMKAEQKELNGGTFTFTQTHENISVNQKFSPSDFQR